MSDFLAFDLGKEAAEWAKEPRAPATVASVATVAACRDGIATLDTNAPPFWIEKRAWKRLLGDLRAFDRMWLEEAVALGWTVQEMFGLYPNPTARRVDCMGLAPSLNGRTIIGINADTATIANRIGAPNTYYRCFDRTRAKPVWELMKWGLQ